LERALIEIKFVSNQNYSPRGLVVVVVINLNIKLSLKEVAKSVKQKNY